MVSITNSYSPVSEETLTAHEAQWGYTLPADYRLFLRTYNGGEPEPSIFKFKDKSGGSNLRALLGINGSKHDDTQDYMRTYTDRLPTRFHPIGYDSGGNVICISVAGDDRGKIYFWDHELEADPDEDMHPDTTENITLISDSFTDLIKTLLD